MTTEELHTLLAPTRLYHDVVKDIKAQNIKPKASAHITGGGLPENLERLFGEGIGATLELPEWDHPIAQKVLEHTDAIDRYHTFNMGFGWVSIVKADQVDAILGAGPGGQVIGHITAGEGVTIK